MRFLSIAAVLLGLSPLPLSADDTDAEVDEALTWFETLGYPSVKGCKYVSVKADEEDEASGYPLRFVDSSNEDWQHPVIEGFLLEEDEEQFTVFTPSLFTLCFERQIVLPRGARGFKYEVIRLEGVVDAMVKLAPQNLDLRRLRSIISTFVLARGRIQNGLVDEGRRLVAAIKSLDKAGFLIRRCNTIKDRVVDMMQWELLLRARREVGVPSIPRTELLRRFEWLDKQMHCDFFDEEVLPCIETLRLMIKEDEAKQITPRPKADDLVGDARARRLVYALRDQPEPVPFLTEEMPYDRLLAMGALAVPALIDAIDDQRFTRWVPEYDRSWAFGALPYGAVRIGRCAEDLLREIAPEVPFFDHDTPEEAADAKAKMHAWWNDHGKARE